MTYPPADIPETGAPSPHRPAAPPATRSTAEGAERSFSNVLIGTAGWSYPDWKGPVYPPRAGRDFDPLAYLAGLFPVVEVDSTFYRIPDPLRTAEWVRKTADSPGFRFTVKLFQGFTHTRKASIVDERAFRRALEPMRRFDRLEAVLLQWPWSFRCSRENREALAGLLARFAEYPLVAELRHSSWASADTLSLLRERGAAFCNIDQPPLAQCVGPTGAVTERLAYFRFHGRNAAAWFAEGVNRDERYNYLYSDRELQPWVSAVAESASVAGRVVVIFNNHFRGKAVANAFQFRHALTGEIQGVPPQLLGEYPHLQDICHTIFQRPLFG